MHVWSGSARLTTISRSKETNPLFWRLGVLFSGSAPTAFCRDDSCGPRTDRNAKDLDHHKTERLSRFSSCGPSVRHRAAPHEQKERQELAGNFLRPHQPPWERSRPATRAQGQPGALGDRELPLHDRLEL